MADSLETELQMMWKRIYAQCQTIAQQEVQRLFGSNVRGGALNPSAIQPGTSGQLLTTTSSGKTAWAAGIGLELTDGTTDLSSITKVTVNGATVSGTSPDATLTISGGTGISQVLTAGSSSSPVTWATSGAFTPVPDLSISLTVTATTTVIISWYVSATRTGPLRLQIYDGASQILQANDEEAVGPEGNLVYGKGQIIYGLAAGTHTLTVQQEAAETTDGLTFYDRWLVVMVL